MAKNLKKIFLFVLATIMCFSTISLQIFAEEQNTSQTIWYGGEMSVDVKAGENGYTFMSVYDKPHHAYEMSNHMVSTDGGINHDIPQTLVMIDASKDYTWTPSDLYSYGKSNYEVLYCCDAETGYNNGIYYKRMNLEDSDYYDADKAAHIRAIVTNSYPYVSLEQMKKNLAEDGFVGAETLTRAEIITAVQSAIWAYANNENYTYSRTFHVPANAQWGGVMHDFTNEMDIWWLTGRRQFSTNDETAGRINALINHLMNEEKVFADKNQVVISDLKMVGAPVLMNKADQSYKINLALTLNNSGSGYEDDIAITVTTGDAEIVVPVIYGIEEYTLEVNAKREDEIKAVVSGTQVLPKGVYFYEPEGGRDVSQCLVGVAMGKTSVYSEDSVCFNDVTFKAGTASNISYMLINKETGAVEFIDKIDLDKKDTFAPIITKEGYIAAMFIKQSTTGLFWIEEEVDTDIVNDVIESLKENNPSYKTHDAVAFGEGEHDLIYKKGKKDKTVTYFFG